jgi:hypothetical protein
MLTELALEHIANISTLNTEVTCPTETSVDFQHFKRRSVPEDINNFF